MKLMKMEALDPKACFMVDDDDDILNFSLDDEKYQSTSSSFESSNTVSFLPDDHGRSFTDFVEEELEWLSNKDAFPAVEFDMFSDHVASVIFDHHSPVSVPENSSSTTTTTTTTITSNINCDVNVKENTFMSGYGSLQVPVNYPVRARSKRRRRTAFADLQSENSCVWGNITKQVALLSIPMTKAKRASIGRSCQHCGVDKTPQWRAGPTGPKTLCNACGVRYKSGRLLPEYRPANSPTISADLYSNSHRKVLEMRKQKIVE